MTFRESESVAAVETGQFRMITTEPKRRGRPAQVAGKVEAHPVDDELDRVVDSAIETEATPALSHEALRPSASPAEDPVRLYLKEIGKVSLLKASEEVSLGQRIEVGQIAL
ncbi:MAG: sigma-70 factor domain-containing protein, partial [Gemmatimonadales bacterium]